MDYLQVLAGNINLMVMNPTNQGAQSFKWPKFSPSVMERKRLVDVREEILELKETVHSMTDNVNMVANSVRFGSIFCSREEKLRGGFTFLFNMVF